eukprot:scaffold80407_cov63-Phaeocystis_antarctica.AAC.6
MVGIRGRGCRSYRHYVLPTTECVPMRSRSEGSMQVCACDRSTADHAPRAPPHQPCQPRHARPSHPPPLAPLASWAEVGAAGRGVPGAGAAGVGGVLEPRTQRESPTHATLTREAPSSATMAVVPGGDNKVTWGHGGLPVATAVVPVATVSRHSSLSARAGPKLPHASASLGQSANQPPRGPRWHPGHLKLALRHGGGTI